MSRLLRKSWNLRYFPRLRTQRVILNHENDEVHAVADIPQHIFTCPAVARAAAIYLAAIFASDPAHCCETCACRVGNWADSVSYVVRMALTENDLMTSASEWLLQCYATWAVTMFPVSVNTVLVSFDIHYDLSSEDGAMGVRDVSDC